MLSADDDGIDASGNTIPVLHSYLRLPVRPEVRDSPFFPNQSKLFYQFLWQADGQRH